jgi:hypothetical protein
MSSRKSIPLPKVAVGGDALLTPAAFAKASGISLSTVWRRLRSNELPSIKRAGKRLIPAGAVVRPAVARPVDESHPMWKFIGAAKSGGAGPGSADKYYHLAEQISPRRR